MIYVAIAADFVFICYWASGLAAQVWWESLEVLTVSQAIGELEDGHHYGSAIWLLEHTSNPLIKRRQYTMVWVRRNQAPKEVRNERS